MITIFIVLIILAIILEEIKELLSVWLQHHIAQVFDYVTNEKDEKDYKLTLVIWSILVFIRACVLGYALYLAIHIFKQCLTNNP